MKVIWALVVLAFLASCMQKQGPQSLTSDQVTKLLTLAYAKQDSGYFDTTDTIYRHLLKYEVLRKDSFDIASGYVSLLLRRKKTKDIRRYIDRSTPASSRLLDDRFLRSINLFQVFLIEKQCDSANSELDRLYSFVTKEGAKQLSIMDLDYNRYALLIDCYGLSDSARSWADNRDLNAPRTRSGVQ